MKRLNRSLAMLLTLACLLSCLIIQANAASYPVVQVAEGDYYIVPESNGNYALDLTGGGTATYTQFQLWSLNRSDAQLFHIQHVEGDWYKLVHKSSGKVVNVVNGVSVNDARLWLHPYDGTDACKFRFASLGNGSYVIQNKINNKVLDLNNAQCYDGSVVHLWDCHFGASARWKLVPASGYGSQLANGDYQIALYDDKSLGWNIQYGSAVIDQAHMVVDPLNRQTHETFRVLNRANGTVSIHPLHALDLCLNAQYGASAIKASDVKLHNYEEGDQASLWIPIKHADGSYTLKNAACGYVIDLNCGRYNVGNNFLLWDETGVSFIQSFWFLPVDALNENPSHGQSQPQADPAASAITQRLNEMISGSYGSGAYKAGTVYRGQFYTEQCKGFAKKVHMILFGYNIGSTKSNNYQINISSSNTKLVGTLTGLSGKSDSTVYSLFASARPGDFIQVRRSHGGPHSMIFLSANSGGVTVYECNVDGRNGIQTKTYSWSTFRSKNADVSVYTAKDYRLH